jgi:hypothetical protein
MQISAIRMERARFAAIKFISALFAAVLLLSLGVSARAQDTGNTVTNTGIGGPAPVRYNNRFEAYGGLNLMTFTAGNLQERANLGGTELLGTWWATHHIGPGLDIRGEAGTTPVAPNADSFIPPTHRPIVEQFMLMAGAQYRGPRNQQFALNYHAYGGADDGIFNRGIHGIPPTTIGLFNNKIKPVGAVGVSLDWNRSAHWALRISPDMMLTRFGNEWEQTFALTIGVVYRFHEK